MEKYIFDCRQKLHQSPKFLKRNQKVLAPSHQHVNSQQFSSDIKHCTYLQNKVFLTFDYSYYQSVPKTASMHTSNRINSLYSLVGDCKGYVAKDFGGGNGRGLRWGRAIDDNIKTDQINDQHNQDICEIKDKECVQQYSIQQVSLKNSKKPLKLNDTQSKKSKWRRQKQNLRNKEILKYSQAQTSTQTPKINNNANTDQKKKYAKSKKLKKPINCMPGVGDYYFQPRHIQKRIIYDVKIRGKPHSMMIEAPSNKPENLSRNGNINFNYRNSQQSFQINRQKGASLQQGSIKKFREVSRSSKTGGKCLGQTYQPLTYNSTSNLNIAMNANSCTNKQKQKDRRHHSKFQIKDQQYAKFANSIDVATVWNKLMQKYRLKGTKFDLYGRE